MNINSTVHMLLIFFFILLCIKVMIKKHLFGLLYKNSLISSRMLLMVKVIKFYKIKMDTHNKTRGGQTKAF